MADLSHYNVPLKGMSDDLTRFNQNADNYTFALNAVLEDRTGNGLTLQNEMSNKCSVAFPPDYKVIGFIQIPEQHRTIYALVNTITGNSQIGEALDCIFTDTTDKLQPGCPTCENTFTSPELSAWETLPETCYCQYYTIVDAACLNFNIHYPVDIEYKITSCGVNIYFTDNLNERRYLYFDYTDLNNTESRLVLQDQFKVILQSTTETTCTCPQGYTLNQETKQCTKTTQSQMEGCDGTIITVDGIEYCQQTDVINATCQPCTCPTGYTLNTTTNQCVKVTKTPLVPTGKLRTACHVTSDAYTNFGVLLYSSYDVTGKGVFENYHLNDPYWSNNNPNDGSKGVLNRTALWACSSTGGAPTLFDPLNEYIGFIYPVDLPTTKTYYIGIAGDNAVRIRIDCNTIVDMDPNSIGDEHTTGTSSDTFKYWHIYPVKIPAGHHIIELTGINYGSVAGFGAEIYNNTAQEIINSKDGTGLNIIFSTSQHFGQQFQVSNTFSGSCPDGTCLDVDANGNLFCTQTSVTTVTCPPCGCPTGYTLNASTNKCTKITQTQLGTCDGSEQEIDGIRYCIKTTTVDAICETCPPTIVTDQLDCEKLKVHPNYERPCIDFVGFVNGGILKEGTYQVLIAYADQYGNPVTEYMPASQTIPLFQNAIKFETDNVTSKAIHIRISDIAIDTPYKYYNVVIASTIEQFTTFTLADTLPITQTDFIYTGLSTAQKTLTVNEVLFTRPYYELAKGITTANNYSFYTGVKEYKTLNLQPVANSIKLQWETVAIKEKAYSDPRNTFYFHTYQRDEVYALGVIFEYNNGRNTCVFHIPGRAATAYDLDVIENNDVLKDIDCNASIRNRRWQVYNTGSVKGSDYHYNEICQIDKCWEYGDFAYWESTETYPNIPQIWGDLACKPIRHHKFPDSCVTHIHDSSVEEKPFTDDNYIFPIGIRVDHQSVLDALTNAVQTGLITQKERDSITSYRIVRGNRVGNKSINAKGLLFNMFKYTKFDEDYYFPNYAYNDLSSDDFLNGTVLAPQRYTFHSPDTHFVNAGLGNILKIETEEFGKSDGYFTRSECQAKQKFLSRFAHTLAFGLGLAAALSATGAKKCKVITQKSERRIIPITAGTVPGAIATIPTPIPFAVQGDLMTINPLAAMGFERYTGLEVIPYPLASESSVTTCKGEPYQIFEDPTSLVGILLAGVAGIAGIVTQRFYLGLVEMNKVMDTMRQLIPNYNYSVQYNSIGKYNNYTCVAEGNKVRQLDKTAYLAPIIQTIDEATNNPKEPYTTIHVNNWNRESSVYLKTNTPLADPQNIDDSKVSMRNANLHVSDLDKHFNRKVSSYYVSVKTNILNQYGKLCDINYIETSPCSFYLNKTYTQCQTKVFGGDTFINRFALKRKMPFFLHTMCNMPDGSDVLYKELFNVAEPKYWFNTPQPLFERISDLGLGTGLLSEIYDDNERSYDVQGNGNIRFYQDGLVHLYNYGIPYFLVESDINVSYRHGQNNKEKDFYPHNTNLKEWLEEANTPILEDNTYFYNRTYSKQDSESTICRSCILNYKDLLCQPQQYNRLIYSEPTDTENKNDNWLIFKANNYYDFPLTMGRLISADGIENSKVLARLEKGTQLFPAYNTIVATEQNIQVGTGGMFKNLPEDIAVTKLGYAGTQNRDIKHTEYGHIWADAERGQIFNLGTGGKEIDEITKYGKKAWFKENLPFQIRKDFPNIQLEDIDNNFWGIGLHYCFDRRFNRLLVTKLDYKVLDNRVQYDLPNKRFIIPDLNPTTAYKCLEGYTSINGVCTKEVVNPATKSGSLPLFTVTPRKYFSYGIMGAFVYDEGFNVNGTGSGRLLDVNNPYWNNKYVSGGPQYLDGPLNRCGFWNSNTNNPINTWVGITFPVNVTTEKIYYVGMAADNRARIRIGCTNLMTFDENEMATQAGTDIQVTFKRWHIYPVLLKKGINYITLEGYNLGSEGAFGAEIYGNTFEELNAAQENEDLNIVFSTSQLFNKTIDSFNYTCNDCVNPIEKDGQMVCIDNTTTDLVPYKVYNPAEVSLNDPKYFCNKSWTMSYNFYTKQWVSYHSYKPNFYVEHIDNFDSGFTRLNQQHTYTHNISNKSYQVFYGKLEPFIVDLVTKQIFTNNYLQSFEFNLDTIRYHNQFDEYYNQHITFNKAIVFNTHQTTGLLNLIVTDPNKLQTKTTKAKLGYNTPITNSEGMWRFNNIFDATATQNSNVPLFVYDCSNTHQVLNPKAIDYNKTDLNKTPIRQRMCKVRLINDAISNHHFILNFAQTNIQTSIR